MSYWKIFRVFVFCIVVKLLEEFIKKNNTFSYIYLKGGIFIESSKKFLLLLIALIVLFVSIATVGSFAYDNDLTVNVYLDGENVSVDSISMSYRILDAMAMKGEMQNYVLHEMNTVDSNASTLKVGLTEIAHRNGFENVEVNVRSQFGEDEMPMKIIVDGLSMYPTLDNGEVLIIQKTNNPKIGDIIVVKDPEHNLLIKRLGSKKGDMIFLSSDNNDTIYAKVDGQVVPMEALEKWTEASNVVGVAKIFNVGG